MKKRKKRVAIIGCGGIFEMHAVSLSMLNDVEIIAVSDLKIERAREKATKYKCNYYENYITMLDGEKPDYVHICTPHYLHYKMSMEAIKRRINVICEKPMALSFEEAAKVINASNKNGVQYAVVFQNRYNPGTILAGEEFSGNKIGNIISVKISLTWNRGMDYYKNSDWKGIKEKEGGGVIIDQAIHSLDLVTWIIEKEIKYVDASCRNRLHPGIDVEDEALGVFFLENIPISFYAVSYFSNDFPVELVFHCENGLLIIKGDEASVIYHNGRKKSVHVIAEDFIDFGEGAKEYWGMSHYKLISDYYSYNDYLKWNKKHYKSYLKLQKLVMSIYESSVKGIPISFDKKVREHDKTFNLENA